MSQSIFEKAHWSADSSKVKLSMPLTKVDKQNRLVSGIATVDTVDTQKDVVTADASAKAFARARGNLREMHMPIAVGRIVDFEEREYFLDGVAHNAIYVTAYVSEGAPDTWTKVLDGTLTGFSIGGEITEENTQHMPGVGPVRYITDYELVELSLVDNPANQDSNIISIHKSAGSVTVEGMAAEVKIESVFYCESDELVQVDSAEEMLCLNCGSEMKNIGWFESGGTLNRAVKVREVFQKFSTPDANDLDIDEGGVEMEEEVVTTESTEEAETTEVEEVQPEVVEETESAEEPEGTEETVYVDEVTESDEDDIAKKIDELREAVSEALEKSRTDAAASVKTLEGQVSNLNEIIEKMNNKFDTKLEDLGNKLELSKSRIDELDKTLSKVNNDTAVKKSRDGSNNLPRAEENNDQVTWNGAFFSHNLFD